MQTTPGLVVGWVVSAAAFLRLLGPLEGWAQSAPPNDRFEDRITISGHTNQVMGSNVGATRQDREPGHAGYFAAKSVWWSWTAPATENITISTAGSDFDTVLGIYTGTQLGDLRTAASNDDGGRDETSIAVFRATAGTTYFIAVDGYLSATGSIVLSINTAGYPAPQWELLDVNNRPVRSTNFQGKVVIVNFWYTTCGPCVDEVPGLVSLYEQYRGDGLVVVGISVDVGGPEVVNDFMNTYRMTYPVVMSGEQVGGDVERRFGGIPAFPTSFVIDRQNQIVGKHVGARDRSFFEQEVLPLLYADLKLAIGRSLDGLSVSWPSNQARFSLEYSDGLANFLWMPLTNSVAATNGGIVNVSLPAVNPCRFYRLKR